MTEANVSRSARPSADGHVVVLNGYSRHNTGDWLLFEESVILARRRHPEAAVVGVAMDADSFRAISGADRVEYSPASPGRSWRGALGLVAGLLTRGRLGSPGVAAILGAKRAYSVGGGFIQFRSGRELLVVLSVHISQWLTARVARVELVLLPQSIGPFGGGIGRRIAAICLALPQEIYVRDAASLRRIEQLGSERITEKVKVLPDLVFLEPRSEANRTAASGRVGIVVRNWWFPDVNEPELAESNYLLAMADCIERLRALGMVPELIVHSDGPTIRGDDRIATSRVNGLLDEPAPIVRLQDSASAALAAKTYADYELVISVRMHAALLALRNGAAAIAIAYEPKTTEIFGQLAIPEWSLSISEIDGQAIAALAAQAFPQDRVTREWNRLKSELDETLGATT